MLNQSEEEFVELILEVGSKALDQDTFQFMIDEGIPVDQFGDLCSGYDIDEVVKSLEEKGLAHTESQKETIRYTDFRHKDIEEVSWGDASFKTVNRQYIYFTKELEDLYRT